MGAGSILKKAYVHWWRHRRGYRRASVWVAVLNAGVWAGIYALAKVLRGDVTIGHWGYGLLIAGLLSVVGLRAAAKIRLIYAVRDGMEGLPDTKTRPIKAWARYLYGHLILALPALVIPVVIWYEAPFCILLLRWRMHFLPYTAVVEPDRDIGRNGIRRGQGMVWPVCITAFGTKWAAGLIWFIAALSLWLASADDLLLIAICTGAFLSIVVEPLYQTGNLLLYRAQYYAQVQPRTFWMDMARES